MKKGLEVRNVPKHSKYSGISQVKYDFSRLDVRFLQGKSLLASDVLTGKSDPVCFVWIGPGSEEITKDDLACEDKGILHTKVCQTTVDPIWNEDIIFELPTLDINELSYFKLVIFVRDEDIMEDESISYDELGIIIVPFRDIILNGKAMKDSIVLSARWYTLVKTPGMRKVDGSVKLTVSLIFHKKDSAIIMDQVDEKYKEADTSSCHGIGLTAQHAMAGLLGNPLPMRTPSPSPLRGSSDNLLTSRLTTARSRSSSRASSPSSVLRRPATAPSIRRSISNLDTVEENGSVMGFEQENSQDENGTYRGGSQGGNSRSDLSLDFSKLSGDKRKGALKEGNKNKIATKQSSTTEEQNNANTSQNGSEIDENESNQFNNNTDQQDEQEYDENDAVIGEEIENSNEVEVNNQDASEAVAVDDSRATLQRQNHLRPNRPNGVSSKIVEPQSTTGSNPGRCTSPL